MPNDEDEQTRLQILHGVFQYILGNRLTTVPLHDPEKILDIGTGTGEWAMAMGDEFPDAEIIGTDIARIQPSAVPENVFFEIDDAEEDGGWMWPENEFDLVHFRSMAGAFTDWRQIYKETFKHLKPGGWIEVIDYDSHRSLMSYFGGDEDVAAWLAGINEAADRLGKPRGDAHLQPEHLSELGYVDVVVTQKVIPVGTWPEAKEDQKIGTHFLVAQLCGIEAVCIRPLIEVLNWDVDKVKRTCAHVSERLRSTALDAEKSNGMGFTIKVLVGRKPGGVEEDVPDEESIRTMTNGALVPGN